MNTDGPNVGYWLGSGLALDDHENPNLFCTFFAILTNFPGATRVPYTSFGSAFAFQTPFGSRSLFQLLPVWTQLAIAISIRDFLRMHL